MRMHAVAQRLMYPDGSLEFILVYQGTLKERIVWRWRYLIAGAKYLARRYAK